MNLQFDESMEYITRYLTAQDETELTLPEGVKLINSEAFVNSKNLVSVRLPSTLEELHWGAFKGCMALKEVSLPDNECFIDENAFADTAVETLYLPEYFVTMLPVMKRPLTEQEEYFRNLPPEVLFQLIDLPDSYYRYEETYDYDDEALDEAFDPYFFDRLDREDAWWEVENAGFYECIYGIQPRQDPVLWPVHPAPYTGLGFICHMPNLKDICLDQNNPYYTVFDHALYNKSRWRLLAVCGGRETIRIAISCKALPMCIWEDNYDDEEDTAIHPDRLGSYSLKEISVEQGNTCYSAYDGALYDKDKQSLIAVPVMKEKIQFPETIRRIEAHAFQNTVMKEVTIPETVEFVGEISCQKELLIKIQCHDRVFHCNIERIKKDYGTQLCWPSDEDGNWFILKTVRAQDPAQSFSLFEELIQEYQQELIMDFCERYPGNQAFYEALLRLGKEMTMKFMQYHCFSEMKHLLALKGLSDSDAKELLTIANQKKCYEMQMLLMKYISGLSQNPFDEITDKYSL
ncbi:MAG: leucine-rich repeat protein [Oscillospiraceae bacterium]|nr:leucine-rich repeat protein [Oscillospiraceae bacterium]